MPKFHKYSFSKKDGWKTFQNGKYEQIDTPQINPAEISESDVSGRDKWIRVTNNDLYPAKLDPNKPGKWIIEYKKGSASISETWERIFAGISKDELYEIKASSTSDEHDTQVLLVYVADADNFAEVKRIFDLLTQNYGVPVGDIKGFKKDISTMQNSDVYLYKPEDMQKPSNATKSLAGEVPVYSSPIALTSPKRENEETSLLGKEKSTHCCRIL